MIWHCVGILYVSGPEWTLIEGLVGQVHRFWLVDGACGLSSEGIWGLGFSRRILLQAV
jgi:hypothetical protein